MQRKMSPYLPNVRCSKKMPEKAVSIPLDSRQHGALYDRTIMGIGSSTETNKSFDEAH